MLLWSVWIAGRLAIVTLAKPLASDAVAHHRIGNLQTFFQSLSREYDLVLIDAGTWELARSSLLESRAVDAVVCVRRTNSSGEEPVEERIGGAILPSERLERAYPSDGFQGEEGGSARSGSLRWVVDPIDGTANFMRGGKRFCVSLGCLEGDTPLIGVIVAPALRETFAACLGAGATLNGAPIHAAETTDLARATVELGWSQRRSKLLPLIDLREDR